jgi:hypothetical protein
MEELVTTPGDSFPYTFFLTLQTIMLGVTAHCHETTTWWYGAYYWRLGIKKNRFESI